MGNYRGKFDIIADMLRVISSNDGAKKTQIMYGANLSYNLLKRYLDDIVEACLIRFEKSKQCYVLTSKGKEFLIYYREYSRRNRRLERQMENINAKKKLLEELVKL